MIKRNDFQSMRRLLLVSALLLAAMPLALLAAESPDEPLGAEAASAESKETQDSEQPRRDGASSPSELYIGLGYIAAALSVGLGSLGAGIAVASTASAAVGAVAEKEDIAGKALVFVGLDEGIAIYGIVIALMILNRL